MRDHLPSLIFLGICGVFLLGTLVGCVKPPVNLEHRILALEESRGLQNQRIQQQEAEISALHAQVRDLESKLGQRAKEGKQAGSSSNDRISSQAEIEKKQSLSSNEDNSTVEFSSGKVDALAQDLVKTHGGQDAGEAAYEKALDLLRNKNDVEGAKKAFDEFLVAHKEHRLIPNALYWLGETYYVQKRFAQAILTYKEIPKRFPTHTKASDALFKIGLSYISLGDIENARFNLETLVKEFPRSSAAPLAEERLKKMK